MIAHGLEGKKVLDSILRTTRGREMRRQAMGRRQEERRFGRPGKSLRMNKS